MSNIRVNYYSLIGEISISFTAMDYYISQIVYGIKLPFQTSKVFKPHNPPSALLFHSQMSFFEISGIASKYNELVKILSPHMNPLQKKELKSWLSDFHKHRVLRNKLIHSLPFIHNNDNPGNEILFFNASDFYRPFRINIQALSDQAVLFNNFANQSFHMFERLRAHLNPATYG